MHDKLVPLRIRYEYGHGWRQFIFVDRCRQANKPLFKLAGVIDASGPSEIHGKQDQQGDHDIIERAIPCA
ncbi:hypothetical protein [Sphingobium sp. DN12]|uniref:hypothetical protein n=1 Tax=Sphingobium sp. DN12 TaxID=3378073 RepID=UPI003DA2AC7A